MAELGAIATIAAVGYGIYQGVDSSNRQRKAIHRQEEAQKLAESRAQQELRQNAAEFAAANKKKPDITSILDQESKPASSLITGPGGINPSALSLGHTSLLGM